ncbi:type III-B CRISPR module RAMP protein Cmr4 [Thiospirillum jenense]|uniref:Type III-B CRISPR module RAMP protein Cmr4 n=1 Tax=Thiospirillum jenense TaxID=1653858 RepID=A0A839HJ67_9GAMM|nr:type III-B CRISPR module RAMP protein Cmr4 [Thiospirillum jenense]MBB1126679.1 type III-B CRISPR module RAMP protein Cmr4 [Thiospirillum jenense]
MSHTALLGLLAETSIHAGAGQMATAIDLPIQREAHTGWPVIFGSAVKGALRARAEEQKVDWLFSVFGPDVGNAHEHAGALLVGDARLLLLPVRSLTGHFKWVTCPALLKRFAADAKRLELTAFSIDLPFDLLADDTVLLPQLTKTHVLYLEEFQFNTAERDFSAIIPVLAKLMGRDDAEAILNKQLVLVNDDRFNHLAQFATPVNPHICIDNATKTVKPGALWYEETLPPDTLLYVALHAQSARMKGSNQSAAEVLKHVTTELFQRPYLQLGGNETVGMGWCKVSIQTVTGKE